MFVGYIYIYIRSSGISFVRNEVGEWSFWLLIQARVLVNCFIIIKENYMSNLENCFSSYTCLSLSLSLL